jgi:hypothetical protein
MRLLKAAFLSFAFVPVLVFAQLDRGSIVGTVTDPSTAAIPGVKLEVRNAATGAVYTAETNETGQYSAPNLPAGPYIITFEANGFKKLVRSNLEVRVADTLRVDVRLEVGAVTESIEISAESPRLATDSPTLGTSLTTQALTDLPLDWSGTRNAASFAFKISPGVSGSEWTSHVNGSQSYTKDTLMDGASVTTYMGGAFSHVMVSTEALAELNVQTNGLSAEFGRSQGGIFNFGMKSGANEIHGSAYGALHNEDFNANTFSNKARGVNRALDRKQNFAFSFGGPVYIPKLYNGRNKTFFYVAYERYRERTLGFGSPSVTLPQPEFYNGDFSRLLGKALTSTDALGRQELTGAIYDPATFRQLANGAWVGDMFPGNIIPKSRFSAVSQKLNAISSAHYLPQVKDPSGQYPLTNNGYFPLATQPITDQHLISIKADHNISDKQKLSGSYSYDYKPWENNDQGGMWDITDQFGGPLSKARWQRTIGQLARLNHDYTLNAHMLNHVTVNYNRFTNPSINTNVSVDGAATLGIANLHTTGYPYINWGGGPIVSLAQPGYPANNIGYNVSWGFMDTFNITHGRHFMKIGIEAHGYQLNSHPDTNPTFGFAARSTAIPNDSTAGNYTGYSFASYLLGIVDNASVQDPPVLGGRRYYYAGFFQDDFKVNSRLSLNLGLRWDHQPPAGEVVGRMAVWDPTITDPASGLKGAYAFGGSCNACTGKNYFGHNEYRDFGPRIGFAWRPFGNLTIRGGYGIVYSPDAANNYSGTNVQSFPWTGAYRYSNDPITPWTGVFNWDSGLPLSGYQAPVWDRSFANTNSGGMSYIDPRYGNNPYVQEWSFNIQHDLFRKTFIDVGYVGTKATGLYAGLNRINQIPWSAVQQYGTNLSASIKSAADAAKYGIPYPYAGFNNTLAAAIRQYPQIYGAGSFTTINGTDGFSSYNSLQVTVNRQVSHGLQIYSNYVWSKDMSNLNGPLDVNNRKNDRAVESFDIPHMLKAYVTYELPIGKGHALLGGAHGALNTLVKGWSFDVIANYFSGTPLGFSGTSPMTGWNGGSNRANVAAGPIMLDTFDKSKFNLMNPSDPNNTILVKSAITDPGPLHMLGTSAARYTQARGFATRNEDVGLQKINSFGAEGKYKFKLRVELLNALNRHTLGGISTSPTSTTFGQVTSVSGNRIGQVVARLDF